MKIKLAYLILCPAGDEEKMEPNMQKLQKLLDKYNIYKEDFSKNFRFTPKLPGLSKLKTNYLIYIIS